MKKETKEFRTYLEFEKDRHLVGVKFLFTRQEYLACPVNEATHQMFFCMMVKSAVVGHSMKVAKEHIYCSAASDVLGFTEPGEDIRNGKTAYQRRFYGTPEIAKEVSQRIPYLHHQVYGMCIRPLEECEQEPDVVMAFCKPYTAMRIIQGYSYIFGVDRQIQTVGMGGICTELMAGAYQRQDMNASFLCSGTRFAGSWRDDEVGMSFPYVMFLKVLDGVKQTADTFEPDEKKEEIQERGKILEVPVKLEMGTNYHKSSLGVARMGVTGYYPRKRKKE